MTVAVGMVCKGAVLLCADTLYTSTAQTHDQKIGHFSYPGGEIAFAVAGHASHAWKAVERLKNRLQNITDPTLAVPHAERVLAAQYKTLVSNHPDRASDYYNSLGYELLLVFWSNSQGLRLFYTSEKIMHPVTTFHCIGAGADLAKNLIDPIHANSTEPHLASYLASYALKACKVNVTGCGGSTSFLTIESDGEVGFMSTDLPGREVRQIEDFYKTYEYLTRGLLMEMANPEIEHKSFWEHTLKQFATTLMEKREDWSKFRDDWEGQFEEKNPHLHPSAARKAYLRLSLGLKPKDFPMRDGFPEEKQGPQSTIVDPSPLPPSQESPEGSNES